jgi:hypothetical protein
VETLISISRFLLYLWILVFIPLGLVYIFLNIQGVYLFFTLLSALLLIVYFYSEKLIQYYFPKSEKIQKNIEYSFINNIDEIFEEYPELKCKKKPKIVIYQDPSPNILIFKLPLKRGVFYLSQGVLTLLNEEEVRLSILCALRRYKDPHLATSSFCSVLTLLVFLFIPKTWIQFILDSNTRLNKKLDIMSVILFLFFLPFLKGLLTLGRYSKWRKNNKLPLFIEKKIQKDQAWWTYTRRLGFSDLYLAEPFS